MALLAQVKGESTALSGLELDECVNYILYVSRVTSTDYLVFKSEYATHSLKVARSPSIEVYMPTVL